MYRVRIHGRGGQGIKMASRVLGTALFRSGFAVHGLRTGVLGGCSGR